jgi:hypothetical protein
MAYPGRARGESLMLDSGASRRVVANVCLESVP